MTRHHAEPNINANLGGEGVILPPLPFPVCRFSLNNSEMVKAATLAFYSIQ